MGELTVDEAQEKIELFQASLIKVRLLAHFLRSTNAEKEARLMVIRRLLDEVSSLAAELVVEQAGSP